MGVYEYEFKGEWKNTLVDDMVSSAISLFGTKIPLKPDLTAGISMPLGIQYRDAVLIRVPYYEKFHTKKVLSVSKTDQYDVTSWGYSKKYNYDIYLNYRAAEVIRTDLQIRNCSSSGCSSPTTIW